MTTFNNALNNPFPQSLAHGGTGASLTAANGAIPYSSASAIALLAPTATAGLAFLSGSNAPPTWSNSPPITKINIQTFSLSDGATQTYIPTAGTQFATVELIGAGGGSGGIPQVTSGLFGVSGAGGGGAYARKTFSISTIGASQTITLGAQGAGGAAGANAGGNGGTTSFGTLLLTAGGGLGGAAGSVGSGGSGNINGGNGGNATFGQVNMPGGAGFPALYETANNLLNPGLGGSSAFCGNTNYQFNTSAVGGNSPGGGAPSIGYFTTTSVAIAGGLGGASFALITEFIST